MLLLHLMDLFGTAVFAVSGALRAQQEEMDLFGVLVIAAVTAIGGGTIRDVLLGHPVFWIADNTYIFVIIAATLLTVGWTLFFRVPDKSLLVADAFGLAVFAVLGTQAALRADALPIVAVLMGAITGVAGGVLRDLLSSRTPVILRREIYATAAIAGAVAYILLDDWVASAPLDISVAILVGLALRLAAVRYGLQLPTLKLHR